VADLSWRKLGPGPSRPVAEPRYDPDELLGVVSADLRIPFDPRQVIARVVDGSVFDEYKPLYGTSLVTGWAASTATPSASWPTPGGPVQRGGKKASEFILLANQTTPRCSSFTTRRLHGGKEYEQLGMIKDGAKMINAVSNSTVPTSR